ncbi:alkaline phosphatase [soil metagenome]
MPPMIDRRSLVLSGTFGLGALAFGGVAGAAKLMVAKGFTHSVASGEPGADSILLWTRYVPAGDAAIALRGEIAEDADFTRVVAGGSVRTGGYRDWTAKLTLDGLRPGTRYFYRFVAPDGSLSPIGQARTLPQGKVDRFRIGLFSCSNLPFGYFNAYGHAVAAVERGEIDLVFHVGDYLYEYQRGDYPSLADTVPGRIVEPIGEMIELADYRLRFAAYRSDPDLQRLHQLSTFLVQWDDHESANDSWEGGAENHQPATEGRWSSRRAASIQAYREWMPVSDEPWKSYTIGTLATLYRTESRLLGRTQQLDVTPLFREADPAAALKAFRDGPWQDPSASMLGSAQEVWLGHAMKAASRDTAWQIVGMGTIMGELAMPAAARDWVAPDAPAMARAYAQAGILAGSLGLPFNYDSWDGYPAARTRFLKAAQAADADLVMLSGDSHNAWAFDLAQDGKPVGVEMAGHSVTSPGFENAVHVDPKMVARGLVGGNPELKWADTSQRGYVTVDVTPAQVTGEWIFMQGITQSSIATNGSQRMTVKRGRRRYQPI